MTLRGRYFKTYNISDSNCARFRQTRSLEMNAGLQTVFPSKRIQAIQETFKQAYSFFKQSTVVLGLFN